MSEDVLSTVFCRKCLTFCSANKLWSFSPDSYAFMSKEMAHQRETGTLPG